MELNNQAQLLLEEAKETGCLTVLDRFHCVETDQYAQISFPLNDALSAVSVTEMNLSKPLCEALAKAGIHTYEQVLSVLLHRGQRRKQPFSPAMLDDLTAAVIDFSYQRLSEEQQLAFWQYLLDNNREVTGQWN